MQITIDTETDSKERLLLVAELLHKLAASAKAPSFPQVPRPKSTAHEFIAEAAEEPPEDDEKSDKPALPSLGPGVQYYS